MRKTWWITMAVLGLAAGAAWGGRALWRKHNNLVSLQVRNAPVAEVMKAIERQTGERMEVDGTLDGLVTLDVNDRPLASVLDRVAEQVGARWTTVRAVYESPRALARLESALKGDGKLEAVGWKLLAPTGLEDDASSAAAGMLAQMMLTNGLTADSGSAGQSQFVMRRGDAPPSGASQVVQENLQVSAGGPSSQGGLSARHAAMGAGPAPMINIVRTRSGGEGSGVETETWSPEELVIEASLNSKVKTDLSGAPTAEAAAKAARESNSQWRTYYALRKSRIPTGLAGLPVRRMEIKQTGPGGTNLASMFGPEAALNIEAMMQAQRLAELGKLTPQQRVLRAREKQATRSN